QRIMALVPRTLANAMLAGILLQFGMALFASMRTQAMLVLLMFATFIIARRILTRYAVPLAFLTGIVWAAAQGMLNMGGLDWTPAHPVWMTPQMSWSAMLGVGIPLFIVTMSSQTIPGLAVLRANGYDTPASPLSTWTGLTGLVLAPVGGFSFNLAAIT